MERTMDFTRGPIVGPLLKFSMPILFALFLQALYGAVDLMVVGKFALAQDVSGVAIGSQIMHTVTGLISSLAMGTTILLGQKLGEGNAKSCGKIIGTSIVLFLAAGLLLTLLIPLCSGKLALLMNAPEEAFEQTSRYIAICGAGSLMIVAYNVLGSIMRGLGDSNTPLMTVAIASVCNIAGDLLLVAGFHMGAAGAALATVSSQTISVLISLLILRRRSLPFPFTRRDIRVDSAILSRILRFGTPAGGTLLSRCSGYRQYTGAHRVSRCWRRRESLRLHHAHPCRFYAGHERFRRTESRCRETGARSAGSQNSDRPFYCFRGCYVLAGLFSWRPALRSLLLRFRCRRRRF